MTWTFIEAVRTERKENITYSPTSQGFSTNFFHVKKLGPLVSFQSCPRCRSRWANRVKTWTQERVSCSLQHETVTTCAQFLQRQCVFAALNLQHVFSPPTQTSPQTPEWVKTAKCWTWRIKSAVMKWTWACVTSPRCQSESWWVTR